MRLKTLDVKIVALSQGFLYLPIALDDRRIVEPIPEHGSRAGLLDERIECCLGRAFADDQPRADCFEIRGESRQRLVEPDALCATFGPVIQLIRRVDENGHDAVVIAVDGGAQGGVVGQPEVATKPYDGAILHTCSCCSMRCFRSAARARISAMSGSSSRFFSRFFT